MPLGELAVTGIDCATDRIRWDYEYEYSRRFAATNEIVIVQGSQGVMALKASTGELLWLVKVESDHGDAAPVIASGMVVVSSASSCSILTLDLNTGNELWRARIPDCTYYYLADY